ncbi:MAG: 1,4-dihydroxy-2-naphthoate polyprenyltransferase [Nitriliruptoraceae bacterium]
MRHYIEAARPRTLPAAIAPVLVGTAAASRPLEELSWIGFGLAMVVALSLQVAVNYANDLFDGVKGVDTAARQGPRRAVASGLVTPRAMGVATATALTVAAVAGLVLAWMVGWALIVVGAIAIVAALGYSGGRRPYASRGLGEISVFVFFGLVATVGSQVVQDATVNGLAVVAAVPVGLLAVALLVINNLRDVHTDAATGKRTLAVRLGEIRTRGLFLGLVASSLVWTAIVALVAASPWPLLALGVTPLAWSAIRPVGAGVAGRGLISVLERTGRTHLAYGVLLAVGLRLGEVLDVMGVA